MNILVLNAGSSSQKSCLYQLNDDILPDKTPAPLWEANIDWSCADNYGELKVKANQIVIRQQIPKAQKSQGLHQMLNTLITGETKIFHELSEIDVVGHRIVHGGATYAQATLITQKVKEVIKRLIPLASNHNPAHLEGIEVIEQLLPQTPQVAVFDTGFHQSMPLEAVVYPIPYEWFEKGIRRYGFHGISHQYCAQRAAEALNQPLKSLKLITCHLGNGCSLAAIKDGISINTTMGFTPLEGLMMGTRSGSIDPEIVTYLIQEHNLTVNEVKQMLNQASGLLGVSEISSDMRLIQNAIANGNQKAKLALNMYIHRLKMGIGAMLTSLGGLDALIFTAGIGENSALIREQVCEDLGFLGLKLDLQKNQNPPIDTDISSPDSLIKVLVIHTEEDWAIAKELWGIINQNL